MSNDPKNPGGPAKTILGWMPNPAPGAAQPPAQPPAAQQPPYAPAAAPPPAYDPPPGTPVYVQPPPAYPAAPYAAAYQQYQPPAAPPPQGSSPANAAYAQTAYAQPAPQIPQQPPPQQQTYQPPQQQTYQPPQQPWQPPQPQQQWQPPQPQWQQQPPPQQAYQPPPQPSYPSPSYPSPHQSYAQQDHARAIASADATVGVSSRVRFIRLTYLHLFAAILVFAGLEYLLFTNQMLGEKVTAPILRYSLASRYNWLGVLAIFMAVSWVADYFASHTKSRALQYFGLLLYVIAEALIFLPLLFLAELQAAEYLAKTGTEAHIIRDAAFLTLGIFGALTASVFFSKKDFSYIRGALAMASAAAMVLIVLSILGGFNLGIVFSVAMVILAAGYVLYYTSQVFAHYDPESYVAAALALFSSIALMFWYVIRILMRLRE